MKNLIKKTVERKHLNAVADIKTETKNKFSFFSLFAFFKFNLMKIFPLLFHLVKYYD